MKSTKIAPDIQRSLTKVYDLHPGLREIVKDIIAFGGNAYIVGGAVRDLITKHPLKDIDIEVHDMPLDALEALLQRYGNVSTVGKSFGVLRLHGMDIDWSLPRADKAGRKPEVIIDPHMKLEDACRRRDLTMNALAIDIENNILYDPFDGQKDIERKTLRAPDRTLFEEDPLRLFRVMQFIGRFDMYPNDTLNALCKTMPIDSVSRERIEQEFNKLFLKSKRPSLGIRWLKDIGRLKEIMPELGATVGIEQRADYHPEGDVFEHTMQAIDAAAQLEYDSNHKKLINMYATLCHDLGKATTSKLDPETGIIRSIGHDREGVPLAKSLMQRITNHKDLIKPIEKLVLHHLMPVQFPKNNAGNPAYKKLARKLAPEVTMHMLAQLSFADTRGRNGQGHEPLTDTSEHISAFIRKANELNILHGREEPILIGKDLRGDVDPGPAMGEMLKRAYEIQLEEGIRSKDELKQRVLLK